MIGIPIRFCELMVGLPGVNVLGVEETDLEEPARVHVETREPRPRCPRYGGGVAVKERPPIELVSDWHTVNDAVIAYTRTKLIDGDQDRIGDVTGLG